MTAAFVFIALVGLAFLAVGAWLLVAARRPVVGVLYALGGFYVAFLSLAVVTGGDSPRTEPGGIDAEGRSMEGSPPPVRLADGREGDEDRR